jgi:hypothetical protein
MRGWRDSFSRETADSFCMLEDVFELRAVLAQLICSKREPRQAGHLGNIDFYRHIAEWYRRMHHSEPMPPPPVRTNVCRIPRNGAPGRMKRNSMKVRTGWRKPGLLRRVSVLGLSFALFALQPTLGGAAIVRQSYSRAAVTVSGSLIEFYDYTNAATNTWTTPADFSAGVFDRANSTDVAGSVVLDRIGPEGVLAPAAAIPWWDTQWSNRRCFSIDHEDPAAATVTEYQLHLDFPVTELVAGGFLQADGGDLRAVGAGGLSSLPLWIDDAVPDTIWVQMDTIAAGATTNLCIYYGHLTGTAAPANLWKD